MENKHNTKKDVFTVPEGYFEQLNNDILKATVGNNVATPRHKRHVIGRFYRLTACAAATAILLVFAGNLLAPRNTAGSNTAETESTLAENEYIDNIYDSYSIDEYTFYCYLTDTDFE